MVQNCDELFSRDEFSAAPDPGWPDCFNSGVYVYTPSQDTYSKLVTFAQQQGSFDGKSPDCGWENSALVELMALSIFSRHGYE